MAGLMTKDVIAKRMTGCKSRQAITFEGREQPRNLRGRGEMEISPAKIDRTHLASPTIEIAEPATVPGFQVRDL